MRRLLLALVLLLPIAASSAPTTVAGRMTTHGFPLRATSSLPVCTAGDSCVMDCRAEEGEWVCVDAAGETLGVTQGTGTSYVETPWGWAAQIDADAEAPTIDAARMETILPGGSAAFYSGAFSIFVLAAPNALQNAAGTHGVVTQLDPDSGGRIYTNASITGCSHWGSGSSSEPTAAAAGDGRWFAGICSVSAAGAATVRGHAAEATGAASADSGANGNPLYFGRMDPASGAGFHLNGYLSRVRFYSKALSAAERATLERQAFGAVGSEGRELTTSRASTAWMEYPDGSVHAYGSNLPRIHPTYGLLVEETRTNLLTYSADFSNAAWTKAGTGGSTAPVVTVNQATAPDGTLTADRVDFGATTISTDYSIIVPAAPAIGTYSGSVYARTVSGTGTLYIWQKKSALGSSAESTACALTTTWSRCFVENKAHSDAVGQFGIGPFPSAPDQPASQAALSVYLWGGQLEAGAFSTSPIPTGATSVQRLHDNVTTPTTGWPTSIARICATVTWPINTRRTADGNFLLDSTNGAATPSGDQIWAWRQTGTGIYTGAALSYSPVFPYEGRLCSVRAGALRFVSARGAVSASAAGSNLHLGHSTNARLGSYASSTLALNGYLRDVTVGP